MSKVKNNYKIDLPDGRVATATQNNQEHVMNIFHPCQPSKSLAHHVTPGIVGNDPHPVIAELFDADQRGRERGNEDGHRYIGTAYTCAYLTLWSAATMAQYNTKEK